MSGRHFGEVSNEVAEDGLCILIALMLSSGGRHHKQRRGHCVGRIPG